MGLILDSSILVAAERLGRNARQSLIEISRRTGDTEAAISVLTLLELSHGAARANSIERKAKRSQFIEELITALPVHPVTVAIAPRAGQVDGECRAQGVQIPLTDLLIGITAIEFGYGVATHNARHFELIPRLSVVPL